VASSDDEFMEFAAAAAGLKKMFDSFIVAGFTEDQALKLIVFILTYMPPPREGEKSG
jgi:hypothetical protein